LLNWLHILRRFVTFLKRIFGLVPSVFGIKCCGLIKYYSVNCIFVFYKYSPFSILLSFNFSCYFTFLRKQGRWFQNTFFPKCYVNIIHVYLKCYILRQHFVSQYTIVFTDLSLHSYHKGHIDQSRKTSTKLWHVSSGPLYHIFIAVKMGAFINNGNSKRVQIRPCITTKGCISFCIHKLHCDKSGIW